MNVLKDLKPNEVFRFFEELTAIPRTSGDEKKVSGYLVDFAKERNLEVYQDKALNVIIKKPGSSGYEHSSTVIIQGHMDMVGEKSSKIKHDFLKDPLKLRIEGDFVYATDTTLGGDNGIAVAFGLALLDSKEIPHPPVELLITTNEETGMFGASALQTDHLSGKILLNIDTEEEGVFFVSCAGGFTANVNFTPSEVALKGNALGISVTGLKGGHSGLEIIKQRANAVKLLGRVLNRLNGELRIRLVSVKGGAKHNAIPREAYAVVSLSEKKYPKALEILQEMEATFENEYKVEDKGVKVEGTPSEASRMMSLKDSNNIIRYMLIVPDGVQSMSKDLPGLVESSLNLGVLEEQHGKLQFVHAVRSSVKSSKVEIGDRICALGILTGGEVDITGDYPEWQYEANSKVRPIAIETYKTLYGKDPQIKAIHAGLECGLLKEKLPETDMISFGPNLYDVHTFEEHLSISSVERTWEFIKALLANLK